MQQKVVTHSRSSDEIGTVPDKSKRPYSAPQVEELGRVVDQTFSSMNPGDDGGTEAGMSGTDVR